MKDWRETLVAPNATILRVLDVIDRGGLRIALVVNDQNQLVGTVTDGDVRRGLLRGLALDRPVSEVMNPMPTTARLGQSREAVLAIMAERSIQQIPVLDVDRHIVDVQVLETLLHPPASDTPVVLMLGGRGVRLQPLTEVAPKPMLDVGGRPVLETIVEQFVAQGFTRFTFCVNYLANVIEDHFGNGKRWGATIGYVREREPMGTAGALGLLPERPAATFFVMNGDVLTTVNFHQLLSFHLEHAATATMCVRVYEMQVPYGVARVDGQSLVGFEEKPVQSFFVNAGIYVLEPKALDLLPAGQPCDMPILLDRIRADGGMSAVFPLREYWLDMGRHDDLARANTEYANVFRR